jgi:hypothetical protein
MEGLESVKGVKVIYKEDMNKCDVAAIKYIQKLGSRDMELVIPCNQEIVNIDGRYILRDKKPQYPKTYAECWKELGIMEDDYVCGYKQGVLGRFQQLLTCRDAYWKIAGEQMGLGKPWEPDWCDYNPNPKFKYIITTIGDYVVKDTSNLRNYILAFPTEEMRDEFYENFNDLINKVKELL